MKGKLIKILRIYILLCSVVLFSCSDESQQNIVQAEDMTLFVQLNLSEEDIPITKADSYNDEEITEIDVVIFKYESGKEYFFEHKTIDNFQEIGTADQLKKGFEIELKKEVIAANAGARLMVFANCHDVLANFINTNNVTKTTERIFFHENLIAQDYGKDNGKFPFKKIPLCGIFNRAIVASDIVNNQTIALDLIRSFARIDIGVDMKNKSSLRDYFNISEVYVFGTNSSYRVARHYNEAITPIVTRPNIPDGLIRDIDMRHKYDYSYNTTEQNIMRYAIYVTESAALDLTNPFTYKSISISGTPSNQQVNDPNQEPYNGTFLIIKANYKTFNDRYYRIDIASPNGYLSINRNSLYEVNIKEVSHEGQASLDEAMKGIYQTKSSGYYNPSGMSIDINVK